MIKRKAHTRFIGSLLGALKILFSLVLVTLFCIAVDAAILYDQAQWPARIKRYWSDVSDLRLSYDYAGFSISSGFELLNVSLENAEGYSSRPMLEADALYAGPSLSGGLSVSVGLVNASVVAEKLDNSWNFMEIVKASPPPGEPDSKAAGLPVAIAVDIDNTRITVRDRNFGVAETFEDVDLAGAVGTDLSFSVRRASLGTFFTDELVVENARGRIAPELELKGRVKIEKLRPAAFLEKEKTVVSGFDSVAGLLEIAKEQVGTVRGTLSVDTEFEKRPSGHLYLKGKVELREMAVKTATAPILVENINGTVDLDNQEFNLADVSASIGEGKVKILGFGNLVNGASFDITVNGENLPLGEKTVKAFPPDLAEQVRQFNLTGSTDVKAILAKAPGVDTLEWRIEVMPRGEVNASFDQFAYLVEGLTGELTIVPGLLTFTSPLKSTMGDTKIVISGKVNGREGTFDVRVDADNMKLDAKLRSALQEEMREIYDMFSPGGEVDVAANVFRKKRGEREHVTVDTVLGGNASITPTFFPMKLDNLEGGLYFGRGKVVLKDVRGRFGRTTLEAFDADNRASAHVVFDEEGAPYRMNLGVEVRRLPIDWKLKNALPESGRDIFDQLEPTGWVDAIVTYRVSSQGGRNNSLKIKGRFYDCSIRPEEFPYTFDNVSGEFEIDDEKVVIRNIRGGTRGTRLAAEGTIFNSECGSTFDINVSVENLSFDGRLLAALRELSPESGKFLDDAVAGGKLDAYLRILKSEPRGEARNILEIVPRKASLKMTYQGFRYDFEDLEGYAVLDGRELKIHDLRGSNGPASLAAWGTMVLDNENPVYRLRFTVDGAPMDQLRRAVSPVKYADLLDTFERFNPEGVLSVRGFVDGGDKGEPVKMNMSLDIKDGSFVYDYFRVPVTDIRGSLGLTGNGFTLEELSGNALDGSFRLYDGRAELDGSKVDVGIEFDNVVLDSGDSEILPGPLRKVVDSVKLKGRFSGDGRIEFTRAGEDVISLDLLVRPDNASLNAGLDISEAHGAIRTSGRVIDFKEFVLDDADLYLSNYKISEIRSAWTGGTVVLKKDICGIPISGPIFGVKDITGNLYDGGMAGFIAVHDQGSLNYRGAIRADGSKLAMLAQTLSRESSASGIMNIYVGFFGNSSDDSSLRGGGYVKVRSADVVTVPFFNDLARVLGTGGSYFDRIRGDFEFMGPSILFNRLLFTSNAINLSGDGVIDFDGKADIVLAAYPGQKMFRRIWGLSHLWKAVWATVYKIRVKGKIPEPNVAIIPIGLVVESPYKAAKEKREPKVTRKPVDDDYLPPIPYDTDERFAPGW